LTIHSVRRGVNSFHIERKQVPTTEPLHVTILAHAIELEQSVFQKATINFYCGTAIPFVFHFKFTDNFELPPQFVSTITFVARPDSWEGGWRAPSSVTLKWPRSVSRMQAPFIRVGLHFCDLQWLED
jgi:hypothetical protein